MKIGNIDITRAYFGSLELNSSNAYVGEFKVIEGEEPAWDKELRFTALTDGSTIGMSHFGTNASTTIPQLEYSRDGASWTPWFFETLSANKGEHIYFRGNNPNGINSGAVNRSSFTGTGQFSVEGNIMSILYAEDYAESFTVTQWCFGQLFNNNATIYDAENLIMPATTLATYCYSSMFKSCSSLVKAPSILPATTLATYCYSFMFDSCTSLVNAPELPATSLKSDCYNGMFNKCSSLTTAPELPATSLASYCYNGMFSRCTSLVNAPSILPATTLTTYCYVGMFNGCTSLVNAPIINATSISGRWPLMTNMFNDCSSLTYVKHHITDWVETNSNAWLRNVASSGTVECPAASTIPSDNNSGIPTGWTRVDF